MARLVFFRKVAHHTAGPGIPCILRVCAIVAITIIVTWVFQPDGMTYFVNKYLAKSTAWRRVRTGLRRPNIGERISHKLIRQ